MKTINENPVAASKAIRVELKAKFPKTTFRVRTSRGSCINVTWTDGPTAKQVAAVTGKYALGSFDGMTDSYNYDPTMVVDETGEIMRLGGAEYVFTNRETSPAALAACVAACAQYWTDWAGLQGYERDERVYRILYASDMQHGIGNALGYAETAGLSVLVTVDPDAIAIDACPASIGIDE